ncbi:MAG: hypothetical protein EOP87_19490, partial [Verrucomicrobiaceae bacterium]
MKLLSLSSMLVLAGSSSVFAAATSLSFTGAFDTFYYGQVSGGPPPTTAAPVVFTLTFQFDTTATPAFHFPAGTLVPDSGSGLDNRVVNDIYGYSASSFTGMTFTTAVIPEIGSALSFSWSTADLETLATVGLLGQSGLVLFDEDITTTVPTAMHFNFQHSAGLANTSLDAGEILSQFYGTGPVIADYSLDSTRNDVTFFHTPDSTAGPSMTIYSGTDAPWTIVPEPSALLLSLASGF